MGNIIWDGTDADMDYSAAGNWVGAAAPQAADDVIIPAMSHADATDIEGGLGQSAVALTSFTVETGCYVDIGVVGVVPTYLEIDADTIILEPNGTVRLDIDNSTIVNVLDCKSTSIDGTYGLYFKGTGNTELVVASGCSGKIGIGALEGESAAFTTIRINGGTVILGDTVTMTALVVGGGTVTNSSAVATITVGGGTFTHREGAVTNLYCNGGTTYMNATGTIATIYVRSGATIDFSQDLQTKDVTNAIQMTAGATLRDPYGVVNYGSDLVIALQDCDLNDVTLDLAQDRQFTIAAL